MTQQIKKIIVGSEEWCRFPALGIPAIKARVDSGAKTSSLHAFNIHTFDRDGQLWVSFEIHPLQQQRRPVIQCEARVIDSRSIKSSSGTSQKRLVIKTPMQCGDQSWDVELTLTNRDSMGYRMLLGREAMLDRLLVDPSAEFCLGQLKEDVLIKQYKLNRPQQKKVLSIGLLATNQDSHTNQRIIEACELRGHQVEFFDIRQCYLKLDGVLPEVHYRGGRILKQLDAVIARIRPNINAYGCALVRQFENMGVYSQNTAAAITHSRDALYCLQLMRKSGISIPATGFAYSPLDTDEVIEMVGGAPLMIKLLDGSQSRGGVLAETKKAAQSVIHTMKTLKTNLLIQTYVNKEEEHDLRCFVVDGKVVAAIKNFNGDHSTELPVPKHKPKKIKTSLEERKLAVLAAKVLELKVAAIDIIRTSSGPMLLKVDASPGLEEVDRLTEKDVAGAMIESIEKRLGFKQKAK